MFIAPKFYCPNKNYILLAIYLSLVVFLFPLLLDYLKTFFFLKHYYQYKNTNIPFFIVSCIVVYLVAFPFVSYYFTNKRLFILAVRVGNSLKEKLKRFFQFVLIIVFYFSFPSFILYGYYEIDSLKTHSLYYSDCKRIINTLDEMGILDSLNVYIEHTPFLFLDLKNIHSRILPLENRVLGIKDLLIITDSKIDYFYLNWEGLLFSKVSDEVGIYSNSEAAINLLTSGGYSFLDHFFFEKEISLSKIAKQNNLDNKDSYYIELQSKIPLTYNDQYLYNSGNYEVELSLDYDGITQEHSVIALIEIHLGRIIKKIDLKGSDLLNKRINKSISININTLEQGTYININSFVNSRLSLNSIKIKKR